MEYTVQKLANIAGISARTLRYYDEINILKPANINESGYRIYGEAEVDCLQQILFYKALGVPLDEIKIIITSPDFNVTAALEKHLEQLLQQQEQLDTLIANVEKTILVKKGETTMTDQEKFEGLKQKMLAENEQQYGKELRQKYGDKQINQTNEKLKKMTSAQHDELNQVESALFEILHKAVVDGEDPAGEMGQRAATYHKKWLSFYWEAYSKEAHAGVAQMYVEDERFTAYYDKDVAGTAVFLRDAIWSFVGKQPNA
ncbi:MerR family transcriptional regulator [Longirhabdus pacifica]|uniref:MerR family transcriptional regulator n=1 Tax=Longirhabdus pacifica TaxID=2305227 RepID=UPI0010087A4C|nr:MerR family transcriptional regulator [Longirhabdus pacifica]